MGVPQLLQHAGLEGVVLVEDADLQANQGEPGIVSAGLLQGPGRAGDGTQRQRIGEAAQHHAIGQA